MGICQLPVPNPSIYHLGDLRQATGRMTSDWHTLSPWRGWQDTERWASTLLSEPWRERALGPAPNAKGAALPKILTAHNQQCVIHIAILGPGRLKPELSSQLGCTDRVVHPGLPVGFLTSEVHKRPDHSSFTGIHYIPQALACAAAQGRKALVSRPGKRGLSPTYQPLNTPNQTQQTKSNSSKQANKHHRNLIKRDTRPPRRDNAAVAPSGGWQISAGWGDDTSSLLPTLVHTVTLVPQVPQFFIFTL